MEDFNNQAIVILYPDGSTDEIEVKDKLLHIYYFRMLSKKSPKFKRILKENNVDPNEISVIIRGGYSSLNFLLSELGIISFLNLRIKEIQRNKIYTKAKPFFLVTLPNELTNEQNNYLNNLFKEYDFSRSNFGRLTNYQYIDISYDQITDIISVKHK